MAAQCSHSVFMLKFEWMNKMVLNIMETVLLGSDERTNTSNTDDEIKRSSEEANQKKKKVLLHFQHAFTLNMYEACVDGNNLRFYAAP